MSFIKTEDIRGYKFDSEMVCLDCATEDDLKELRQSELITEDEIDRSEGCYFCDRCDEAL